MGDDNISEQIVIDQPKDKVYNGLIVTSELVKEWYQQHLREGHNISATNTYFSYIKRFVGYEIEINQKNVNKFRNLNMSNVASASLKSLFEFLVDKKDFDPSILNIRFGKSKTNKKEPIYFSETEVEKLIEAITPLREKMLTKLLAECGLRISEGLKLTWSDFNWSEWLKDQNQMGSLTLRKTKGNKFRTIPVSSKLMNEIYDNHKNRTIEGIPIGTLVFDFGFKDYINLNEKDKQKIEQMRSDYLVYAGNYYRTYLYKLTSYVLGKRGHPHSFRHYSAIHLLNLGLPLIHIKEFLGHDSIVSTSVYARSSAESLKKEMEKLGVNNG